MAIKPNVFLIGVQKSATTSVFDWIAQHPNVCGPISMKDTPFFINDNLYQKGFQFIENIYKKHFANQEVILNGSAHTIYFPKGAERIAEYNPNAKLIVILRNPIERAISAYNFAVKRNLDNEDLLVSLKNEDERLKSDNFQIVSETTYIDHGYYFRQISKLREYFKENQILVLLYNDVKNNPEQVTKEIYSFLALDGNFKPEFRTLNKTGSVRFKFIKNAVYNNSKLKKFLVKNVLDKVMSHDLKYRVKISILRLITKDKSSNILKPQQSPNKEAKHYIYKQLEDDIIQLEKMLNKDLSHWKTFK